MVKWNCKIGYKTKMPTEEENQQTVAPTVKVDDAMDKVIDRINDADSILVTLSKDPNVDGITAALGLTMMLDKIGKHATAIYSGKTPNALQFLKPDETFEANTNSLQDFIIALDKEKADHLRYKIEGDFVKVYITPYKTTISEKDLEFSRGEVNVDLVIALDVVEAEDLDAALATHGRIMHNASLINISNSAPGRLGGVEWSNPRASSVSEMIVTLFETMGQEIPKEVATTLLTGIVAATERFSNERTTPETMALASKLMQLGADQQLIVAQMMSAREDNTVKTTDEESVVDDDAESEKSGTLFAKEQNENDGMLDVVHEDEKPKMAKHVVDEESGKELSPEEQLEQMIAGNSASKEINTEPLMRELEKAVPEVREEPEVKAEPLKMEEPVISETSEESAAPEVPAAPVELPTLTVPEVSEFAPVAHEVTPTQPDTNVVAAVPQSKVPVANVYGTDMDRVNMAEKTMAPLTEEKPKDYGAMIDAALAEPIENPAVNPAMMAAPMAPVTPEVQPADDINAMVNQMVSQAQQPGMPAGMMQPSTPMEVQPNIPMASQPAMGGVELPPPPAPDATGMMPPVPSLPPVQEPVSVPEMTQPVMPQPAATPEMQTTAEAQDNSAAQLIPTAPAGVQVQTEPVNPVVVQPDQGSASVPPVQDPGAFKIPGM